jgi:hypothetical protein
MQLIKLEIESAPLVEALDIEKVSIMQENGMLTLVYLDSDKILSVQLDGVAVQIEIHKNSIYVSTKPFAIEITKENESSEYVYNNNVLANRKTCNRLWKIGILEESLTIRKTFDNAGGFAIDKDNVYACNSVSYGFYVLSMELDLLETVVVGIDFFERRPWYSIIRIIGAELFLIQEEERIRWFTLGNKIEEKGIVEPEFIHETSFLSLNAAPKKILKVGKYILGILSSGEPFVIDFVDGKPTVAVDPKTIFTLNYQEKSAVLNRVQEATDQFVLAMDRYRIIVTDAEMSHIQHGFCLDEADETLNLSRLTACGNYAVCFAWTYGKKYPLIVLDLSNPSDPVITKVIDCGVTSGAIKVDTDG